jgi:hypothetical protein
VVSVQAGVVDVPETRDVDHVGPIDLLTRHGGLSPSSLLLARFCGGPRGLRHGNVEGAHCKRDGMDELLVMRGILGLASPFAIFIRIPPFVVLLEGWRAPTSAVHAILYKSAVLLLPIAQYIYDARPLSISSTLPFARPIILFPPGYFPLWRSRDHWHLESTRANSARDKIRSLARFSLSTSQLLFNDFNRFWKPS